MRTVTCLLALLVLPPASPWVRQAPAPANAPAAIRLDGSHVTLSYGGTVLFDGHVESAVGEPDFRRFVETHGDRVTQVLKWTAARGTRVALTGKVHASSEAFAVEVEPREDGLPVVRHAVGPVSNLLNRAVYDRQPTGCSRSTSPPPVAGRSRVPGIATAFRITASGGEVALRFRPRYYQRHRGLAEYRPWTYRAWEPSVAGWTSWYAFFDKVTEQDVKRTADVIGDVLRPFGYRYLQIDDGYQQLPIGVPDHWLDDEREVPRRPPVRCGATSASAGSTPGIWTNVSFQDQRAGGGAPGVVRARRRTGSRRAATGSAS